MAAVCSDRALPLRCVLYGGRGPIWKQGSAVCFCSCVSVAVTLLSIPPLLSLPPSLSGVVRWSGQQLTGAAMADGPNTACVCVCVCVCVREREKDAARGHIGPVLQSMAGTKPRGHQVNDISLSFPSLSHLLYSSYSLENVCLTLSHPHEGGGLSSLLFLVTEQAVTGTFVV